MNQRFLHRLPVTIYRHYGSIHLVGRWLERRACCRFHRDMTPGSQRETCPYLGIGVRSYRARGTRHTGRSIGERPEAIPMLNKDSASKELRAQHAKAAQIRTIATARVLKLLDYSARPRLRGVFY